MSYSRGKKIYRKFESEEEDEEIDPEDLGLLEYAEGSVDRNHLTKPLTRKSVKPTRLFQSERKMRTAEAEKEEEALTDIEDQVPAAELTTSKTDTGSDQSLAQPTEKVAQPPLKSDHLESDSDASQKTTSRGSKKTSQKSSPFDTWKRLKRTNAVAESSSVVKGKKRASGEDRDEEGSKRVKA